MKLVMLGANGRLGAAVAREFSRDHDVRAFTHAQLELSDLSRTRQVLSALDFDLLINCAALTNVDYCESNRGEAFLVNAEAPGVLAKLCRDKDARLVHFSTDYVFDGQQTTPYDESDTPAPVSVYGESKLAGERAVIDVPGRFLLARVSWVFGPDRPSFVDQVIQRAREHEHVAAVADKYSTPAYTLDIARSLTAALEKNCTGILHLVNHGACSWQEYAQHALDCCAANAMQLPCTRVAALKLADMSNFVAKRPVYSALSVDKLTRLLGSPPRSWRDAVADYVKDYIAKQ